ncbi:Exodeoxyribonuclease 7 large subunit [bioreactor metagenome]|uniref:Exodeoxyribonuclease 7 large subunit n=1 Tax=bioreactor metagenome TaxID=1076179 RepID=A0A644V0B8_9ZZZZ
MFIHNAQNSTNELDGDYKLSVITVGDLTRYLKTILDHDSRLASVFVRGEISNFKQHYSGHCYFTLKDNEAVIKAVMFKSRSQYLKFVPTNGLKVIAGGKVTIYERDGQYQLYVEQMMPQGIGELSLAYAQLKEKLEGEGLFDLARKRQLPLLPKSVGVITSPTGAAVRDVLTVAKRRHPGIPLLLYPVQVQGDDAPGQICHALKVFNKLANVDVIILGRGGGSIEELWAFNDERVVRSVAKSVIPIVSAVGHQTDFTLSDFAADIRAATPSQAAEMVIPDAKELSRYVLGLQSAVESAVINTLKRNRTKLEHCLNSRVLTCPTEIIADRQQLLDSKIQRLLHAANTQYINKDQQFKVIAGKLAVLNPLSVLSRGYSIVESSDKRIVKSAEDVTVNQDISIVLYQGQITAKVTSTGEIPI